MTESMGLPEFKNPPVIEVVCGVQFKSIEELLAPHLGLLWGKYRDDYPYCQEAPPLAPAIERYAGNSLVQMELSEKPPLPRVWFVHHKQNGIIQVQRDRFHHNWKKVHSGDEYPRYDEVIRMFREHLETFEGFLGEAGLASLVPQQLEMTYVNHILAGDGFSSLSEVGRVFPDFNWRAHGGDRFLLAPEAFDWKSAFALPNQSGRLHVSIGSVVRRDENMPMLLFELTARGMPKEYSKDAMWAWFDLAHEWIVRSFAELTGENMHKTVWARVK